MHEVTIVEGLLESIEEQHRKHTFQKVVLVELVCGKYNCVSQDSLRFYFETGSAGTVAEGAEIRVRRLAEHWQCVQCSKDFYEDHHEDLICPDCGANNIIPMLNNDLYLGKLEVA